MNKLYNKTILGGTSAFTLLEMLIALALVGVLLTATIGITSRLTGDVKHSTERMNKVQDIYYALNLIEKDIASFHHEFSTTSSSFKLVNINNITWAESKQSGQNEITYEVITNSEDEDEPFAELYRYEKDAILNIEPIKTKLLEANQIIISYYDEKMKEKLIWLSSGIAPVAIKIAIIDKNKNTWERVIPLPTGQ